MEGVGGLLGGELRRGAAYLRKHEIGAETEAGDEAEGDDDFHRRRAGGRDAVDAATGKERGALDGFSHRTSRHGHLRIRAHGDTITLAGAVEIVVVDRRTGARRELRRHRTWMGVVAAPGLDVLYALVPEDLTIRALDLPSGDPPHPRLRARRQRGGRGELSLSRRR